MLKSRPDLTGNLVEDLYVLSPISDFRVVNSYKKYMKFKWNCVCLLCGSESVYSSNWLIRFKYLSNGCKKCHPNRLYPTADMSASWKGFGLISGNHWGVIRHNALKRGLEFNISIEYIWELFVLQNAQCAYTKLDLNFSPDKTASLDRIDSTKGYIHGNVQWVHKYINTMKQDFSHQYFLGLCKAVSSKQRKEHK